MTADQPQRPEMSRCGECEKPPVYQFRVMGAGRQQTAVVRFCERHAEFYLRKGPDIYPMWRLVPRRSVADV